MGFKNRAAFGALPFATRTQVLRNQYAEGLLACHFHLSFINLNVLFVSAKACRGMENVAKSTRIVSLACPLAKVWVT